MGLFSRKSSSTPANPEMAELGREYAIAKRHGDRRTVNRITRQIGNGGMSDTDRASFEQGRASYDAIPPAYSKRRNRRR
jgi:phosphoribosylamine-glycine ligase